MTISCMQGVWDMMEEMKKEFEEYRMKLIWLNGDVICTSDPQGASGEITDPANGPGFEGPEGPDIFD